MAPAAKRRKVEKVEEIVFDPAARNDYLTGFHKRKQERAQNARDAAVKREKEEKVKERRQLREQRREELEEHVAAVKAGLQALNPGLNVSDNEDESWEGVADAAPELEPDEEYVDEDKYTTVTVEAMEGSDVDEGSNRPPGDKPQGEKAEGDAAVLMKKKRIWSKDPSNPAKRKEKKRKFRYESKAERQATRQKQKVKSRAARVRREG